jgi:hypothetical protein
MRVLSDLSDPDPITGAAWALLIECTPARPA